MGNKIYGIIQFSKGLIMNIVIFGATGGIGKCLSFDLINNHNLYIGSRDSNKVDNLLSDITHNKHLKITIAVMIL